MTDKNEQLQSDNDEKIDELSGQSNTSNKVSSIEPIEESNPSFNQNAETDQETVEQKQREIRKIEEISMKKAIVEENKREFAFAGFWMRFWAYLIDLIVIGSVDRIIIKPVLKAFDVSQYDVTIFSPITIGSAIVFYLYFVLMTKFLGQTIGKMVFGLKVVSLKKETLSWDTIIFRELIGRFISKTIWITYVLVGILPKKQGLHDLFSDTSVVLEKKR